MAAQVLSYSEKRLAQLLRRAALRHIRHEYLEAGEDLADAVFLIDWSNRPDWAGALRFVREWAAAVEVERKGEPLPAAPAAWIHLSQELASLLESRGDWLGYLGSRWRVDEGRIDLRRRLGYGFLCALAFGLSGAIVVLLGRHALAGNWDGLVAGAFRTPREHALTLVLLVGRVAGTVMMMEHGLAWGRKAATGRVEEPRPIFLGAGDGLELVDTPSL